MSSYDAVIPVSWPRVVEVIMPAWTEVLAGRRTMASFCCELAPDTADGAYLCTDRWNATDVVPRGYLDEIGWVAHAPIVPADRLRNSALHASIVTSMVVWDLDMLLCGAMVYTASEELSGPDRFDDTDQHRYYGRRHERPTYQVAGSKNGYHFLKRLFDRTWIEELHLHRYVARPELPAPIRVVLEDLFLATRTFPGMCVLRERSAWPAFDDRRLQGVLAPREVQELASMLDEIEALAGPDDDDDLFPLLIDRVRRSADQGLALVTMQEAL